MKVCIYPFLAALLLFSGCTDSAKKKNVGKPPSPPALTLAPAPGSYEAYRLTVTISTQADYQLYFALDTAPVVTPERAYLGSFSVELVRSAKIFVVLQSPSGERYGPYQYEYALTHRRNEGACQVSNPPRQFYRDDQQVPFSIQYQMPSSLARLEIRGSGDWTDLHADQFQGSLQLDLGPYPEGPISVQCRVIQGKKSWYGVPVNYIVDGTPPLGAWITSNFVFTQDSWRNSLSITASDALSGLSTTDFCNSTTGACIPMNQGETGTFFFSTALTDGTQLSTDVYVRLQDVAGNVATLPLQTLDFLSYSDPVPARSPLSITFTTVPTIDFSSRVGASPSEILRFDGSALSPTESAAAVTLTAGLNEFLYRLPGSGHWRSYGIYLGGVEVYLPPTLGQWLVFSSSATLPTMQSSLEDIVAPSSPTAATLWSRPWLAEIPHLFFIEDLDLDNRWSDSDKLYMDPVTAWNGTTRAQNVPVRMEQLVLNTSAAPAYARTVSVSVAGGIPAGNIFFEWRQDLPAFPSLHVELPVGAFPLAVSVPANGICMFFIDVDNQGALSSTEPRAIAPCSQDTFVIDQNNGPLSTVALPYYTLPWLEGIAYDGDVTAVITVSDPQGNSLISYPIRSLRDQGGMGFELYSESFDLRYPNLPATVRFYQGAEFADWTPLAVTQAVSSTSIDVVVADESGAAQRAMVISGSGSTLQYAAVDGATWTPVPVSGTGPYSLYAMRDGMLSEKSVTSGTTVSLRLLSPLVTGWLSGVILDEGNPVVNAEVTWENDSYRAGALTGASGEYALPASGGDGLLTIALPTRNGKLSVSYPLSVTRESKTVNLAGPHTSLFTWPAGLQQGFSPNELSGPSPATLELGDGFYTANITGPTDGLWSTAWPGDFRRYFSLPGALPAFPVSTWAEFPLPGIQGALGLLHTYARCGDWEQEASWNFIAVHFPCWTLQAEDELQNFTLGRLLDGSYPAQNGMGILQASITQLDGSPVSGLSTLMLKDQILQGRTIWVQLKDGNVSAAIPAGVYEMQTDAGISLWNGIESAVVQVRLNQTQSYSLRLP